MFKLLKQTTQKSLQIFSQKRFQTTTLFNNKIEIFIDDKPFKVAPGYTIWQACKEAGVTIPRFCYHERLSIAGNCRMCLVEVEKSPKPVAACASQVIPGMRINTKSEKTRVYRGAVVEFILANHPLDCPICDQGGECDLQDQAQMYGYGEGRYREYRRAVEDKNLGPIVGTSMNRCIHCTRCIRFATEVAGSSDLGKVGRGRASEIGTYIEKVFTNELSGNVIDLCPVGALTSLPYAFQARPYELEEFNSTDVIESIGSSIKVQTRGDQVMRILPNVHEDVNEEWISDKSRYSYDGLKRQRLVSPLIRDQEGNYTEISWEESLARVAQELRKYQGNEISAVIGEHTDCETIVAAKDLLNKFDSDSFEIRNHDNLKISPDFRTSYVMNSRIVGVEDADVLLLVGTDLKQESPVLNSRVLKATRKNKLKVYSIGTAYDQTFDYNHLGVSAKIIEQIASGSHPFAETLKKAKLPMIIVGANSLERIDGEAILNNLKKIATSTNVINKTEAWNGFNVLHKDISRVGALDIGITPSSSDQIKKSKFIFLLGADNNIRTSDIPSDAFVVYIGSHGDEGAYYADIILPGAAFVEKDATYVNTEGRVQQVKRVVAPPGKGREDWMIIRALSEEVGRPLPYDTLDEIRYRLGELAPHLVKYNYIEPSVYGDVALQQSISSQSQINNTPLRGYIDNYYMTDAISRSSIVMAKCSAAFNKDRFDNFIKETR